MKLPIKTTKKWLIFEKNPCKLIKNVYKNKNFKTTSKAIIMKIGNFIQTNVLNILQVLKVSKN